MNHKLDYNFYLNYLENEEFKKKFEYRVEQIKNIYNKNLSQLEVIEEYFVEIFSWTALPIEILKIIELEIKKLGILLNLYQGDMVISFGNYNILSPRYKLRLEQDYKLIKNITLNMPWGLNEDIEIYIYKLIFFITNVF